MRSKLRALALSLIEIHGDRFTARGAIEQAAKHTKSRGEKSTGSHTNGLGMR